MPGDAPHVQFDDSGLYRPQTVIGRTDRQHDRDDDRTGSARRRSSSDPSGRSRQRPRIAVLRPRGNATATPALVRVSENDRLGSTAFFNSPGGQNEVKPELADVLDVIGP